MAVELVIPSMVGTDVSDALVRQNLGKTRAYTQAEIDALDPAAWGSSDLLRDDGVRFRSDGFYFTKTENADVSLEIRSSNIIDSSPVDLSTVVIPPSPYQQIGNGAITHPGVVRSKKNFGGYQYWMAFTPINDADSNLENPCIVASNNIIDWVAPSQNPIVESPTGPSDYNADTSLAFNSDETVLYMIYRERGVDALNNLMVLHTTDGLIWTDPVAIASGAVGARDFASPSLWLDPTIDRWVCIVHNIDVRLPEIPVERMVSSTNDIYALWGDPAPINITPSAGYLFWHSHFIRLDSGVIVGALTENLNASGGAVGRVFIHTSANGLDFNLSDYDAVFKCYRPSLFNFSDTTHLLVYSTLADNFFTVVQLSSLDSLEADGDTRSKQISGTRFSIARDRFNRADNSSAVGATENGLTWTQQGGVLGIQNSQLYNPTTSTSMKVFFTESNNCRCRMVINQAASGGNYLLFRFKSTSEYWRMGLSNDSTQQLILQKISGATTIEHVVQVIVDYNNPVVLGVVLDDDNIQLQLNDQTILSVNEPLFKEEKGYGVRLAGTVGLIDSFLVT